LFTFSIDQTKDSERKLYKTVFNIKNDNECFLHKISILEGLQDHVTLKTELCWKFSFHQRINYNLKYIKIENNHFKLS